MSSVTRGLARWSYGMASRPARTTRLEMSLDLGHMRRHGLPCLLSLEFRDALSAADVERAGTRIERSIKSSYPAVTRVFVEAQSLAAERRGLAPRRPIKQPG